MTLRLTVIASPVPQPRPDFRLDAGRAVVGREEGCDWRLEDPEMFISRRHCLIESTDRGWTVTDTSSGGLFVDTAPEPLGLGGSAVLRNGMRLRLGDVILDVELAAPAQLAAEPPGTILSRDPFFAAQEPPPPPPPRPSTLPDPFDRVARQQTPEHLEAALIPPPEFSDPFTLDLPKAQPSAATNDQPADRLDWDWGPGTTEAEAPPVRQVEDAHPPPKAPDPLPAPDAAAAFLRGAGLDPAMAETVDLEALGRRYRMLAEGVVALLRSRADEKGSLRLARTTIGAAGVNPLKFLAMPEERLSALIAPRGPGYLDPDAAIAEAFRDIADHRLRSWQGLQAALRRMADHFSPKAIEEELADTGALRALLAGGRSALLWEAYSERWEDIARAAEDRFLGEIGAEFRNAYEDNAPVAAERREP